LIDEADGLLKDSRGNDNLELRSIINASHTKDFAYVPRCIEKTHEVKKFSTWAPKAIALIGRMPDSMMDRSIQIPLDRAEDCWLPMLAIAEVAGGDWPLLARKAAVALSADTDDADTFATKLLRALKQDFIDQDETDADGFQLTTDICDHLNKDKEAPWADFKNGMTPEILARNLGRHKVKSDRVMHEGNRVRGFYWQKLKPIFDRYL